MRILRSVLEPKFTDCPHHTGQNLWNLLGLFVELLFYPKIVPLLHLRLGLVFRKVMSELRFGYEFSNYKPSPGRGSTYLRSVMNRGSDPATMAVL